MAIRWNEYRKRRSLVDLSKCFENWGVKNYNDLCKYLWDVGVIHPDEGHRDVELLSKHSDEQTPRPKPTSGRSSEAAEEIPEDLNKGVDGQTLQREKPSSGRSPALKSEPGLEKVRRKRSTGARKKSTTTRKKSQRKTSSKRSDK